jgi:hypothetical protein
MKGHLKFAVGDFFLDLFVVDPVTLLGHADKRIGFLAEGPPEELQIAFDSAHANDFARVEDDVPGLDDADEHENHYNPISGIGNSKKCGEVTDRESKG